ncbi:reprolysin-like metallopeptidase [uncultured Lacinutrix sp.]|uniref:zinc-dependent metalloprotease n=1 Tax=uncultured Lacinutrix sp. TaxID=574032 RepID=UPI002632A780|nr:zinc-dependent metalloprotease family protein [uncultured Lacinutrix sp.]
MKKKYFKWLFTLMLCVLITLPALSQNKKSLWNKTSKNAASKKELAFRKSEPKKADYYQLDINALKAELQNAPNRNTYFGASNLLLDFPTAEGTLEAYRIKEAPIMEEELQNKYPNIRTYVGESVNTPGTVIRFSITSQGLHTMSMSNNNGTQFIDPYTKGGNEYIVYAKKNLPVLDQNWECGVVDGEAIEENKGLEISMQRNADDGLLRNFRIAVATTIEYSSFHWMAAGLTAADSEAAKRTAVMAAVVVTINRNNQIYERDLSITMTLVGNNDSIVFVNSDNFSNDNASALINESQTVINATIGSANYDIGHTFSTGGGGLAQLNSPCTGNKARGITGLPAPVGDAYDIDFVAHELGHQFGAPHTWNGTEGNCTTGARTASNAYEPGSGSTIMAYAGICAPQNVQNNSDAYFHQKSLQMIWDNVTTGNSQCASTTNTGNNAPTSNAGADYIIPSSTPYMLTGTSTDSDGTATHTYTWEQYDLGAAGLPLETNTSGPMVRSYTGTSSQTRFIPKMEDILISGGVSTTWEKLASVARTQNFRLTVRDNDISGGQTAVDEMAVTVNSANTIPFAVTSQSSLTSWVGGDTEIITWDVAGTNAGAVNSPNVDILLSTDGGLTYNTAIATAVPNNGTYSITVPDIVEGNCRIMVKGSNNIFFNINTARIAIGFGFTESCTTYSYAINQTIASNATAFEFFDEDVTDSGIISDVNVKYDITTSNLSQLHLAIIAPNGPGGTDLNRSYLYAAGPCTATDGSANIQVTFDDEASGPIVCGTNPLVGTVTTANLTTGAIPLSIFDGQEMNGTWRFMAANLGSSNMVFNTVDLEICTLELAPLSVEDFDLENSFSVFPNPNNGEFTVKFNEATGNINLEVIDIRGRSIFKNNYNNSGDFSKTINLGSVQSGMYLLRVNNGTKAVTKKIIVE